ncbi:MAG: hypothetical protein HRU15_02450 [Planctomycetes bacterium]|nr:hypothetical protein [Planctomycetota bacterium]
MFIILIISGSIASILLFTLLVYKIETNKAKRALSDSILYQKVEEKIDKMNTDQLLDVIANSRLVELEFNKKCNSVKGIIGGENRIFFEKFNSVELSGHFTIDRSEVKQGKYGTLVGYDGGRCDTFEIVGIEDSSMVYRIEQEQELEDCLQYPDLLNAVAKMVKEAEFYGE